MRTPGLLLITLMGLATTGCASVGDSDDEAADDVRTVDAAPVARSVVLCKTTVSEIQSRLGAPSRDGLLHGKRVVSWIAALDPLERYLAVLVDDRGVIVDLYWDIPSEIPWTPIDQCHGG